MGTMVLAILVTTMGYLNFEHQSLHRSRTAFLYFLAPDTLKAVAS